MKEQEIRKRANCAVCTKPIGHTQLPLFWIVKIERHGINMRAIQQQDGLAFLLGGNSRLAQVMGTDEEITTTLIDVTVTLCEHCSLCDVSIVELAEIASQPVDLLED